ncbi:MAG: DNA-directed RNA polymerase subunit omega [Silvanigrellaceae bacterium]|nr:DNA-directed RNA polymerase subunit omega [Silvanigrellaceae bacterium]
MARISVQDCLDRIPNRFVIVMLAARRMRQLQKGSDALIECKNKEAVTALREIAAGKVGIRQAEKIPGLMQSIEKARNSTHQK